VPKLEQAARKPAGHDRRTPADGDLPACRQILPPGGHRRSLTAVPAPLIEAEWRHVEFLAAAARLSLLLLAVAASRRVQRNQRNLARQRARPVPAAADPGLPGKVSFRIGSLDRHARFAPCSAFEPFLPPGSRLRGKTTVGVRCLGPAAWTAYVSVEIRIFGSYLVTARPLMAGQIVGSADLLAQ
jgi:flagella basal body P-ring formation protein FlgA